MRARRAATNGFDSRGLRSVPTVTAYYRCLFHRLALSPGSEVQIPVMVDMRRYLKDVGGFVSLTNAASTVVTQLEYRPEERFEGTLVRVKAIMDKKKGKQYRPQWIRQTRPDTLAQACFRLF